MPAYRFLLATATMVAATHGAVVALADERRNPFDLPDVTGVEDEQVHAFAAGLQFPARDEDANSPSWPNTVSDDNPMKLDGTWASRWNSAGTDGWSGNAKAKIARTGDRLFIHYYSGAEPASGGYLIEAVRGQDGLYRGRYSTAGAETSSGFWVGRIVAHDRIDGFWTATGRWDFRRRFE